MKVAIKIIPNVLSLLAVGITIHFTGNRLYTRSGKNLRFSKRHEGLCLRLESGTPTLEKYLALKPFFAVIATRRLPYAREGHRPRPGLSCSVET